MSTYYSPGCALLIYKPELADRIYLYLKKKFPELQKHTICCHHEPHLPEGSTIINTCPGCDRRFRSLYKGISTRSLWEVIAEDADFEYPGYPELDISVHDACPVRTEERVHKAVRKLLKAMHMEIKEAEASGVKSKCCGDCFHRQIPTEEVLEQMKKRAEEMPADNVAVYCVSCVKAMKNGGKIPRYLPDLLFYEPTLPGDCDPDRWHIDVDRFIEAH